MVIASLVITGGGAILMFTTGHGNFGIFIAFLLITQFQMLQSTSKPGTDNHPATRHVNAEAHAWTTGRPGHARTRPTPVPVVRGPRGVDQGRPRWGDGSDPRRPPCRQAAALDPARRRQLRSSCRRSSTCCPTTCPPATTTAPECSPTSCWRSATLERAGQYAANRVRPTSHVTARQRRRPLGRPDGRCSTTACAGCTPRSRRHRGRTRRLPDLAEPHDGPVPGLRTPAHQPDLRRIPSRPHLTTASSATPVVPAGRGRCQKATGVPSLTGPLDPGEGGRSRDAGHDAHLGVAVEHRIAGVCAVIDRQAAQQLGADAALLSIRSTNSWPG